MKEGQKFCAVLKANAYGFGAKEVCKTLDAVADYFAVSSAEEFFEIEKITNKPIIILDPVYNTSSLKKLIKHGAELSVPNLESLEKILAVCENLKDNAKIHIALNTGMNRFGFKDKKEILKAINLIKKSQKISLLGVFSHYYQANNQKFANLQKIKFEEFLKLIKENFSHKPLLHLCNSDGVLSANCFDMARVGMALYSDNVNQTVTLWSRIVDIQNLEVGEVAGYNAVFKAKRKTKLATVQIGYGDGLFRNIARKGYVLVNGSLAKIVAVCMDSILIDVTDISVKIQDKVVLIGKSGDKQIFICDVARWCDTIDYEIIIGLAKRVKRKYISKEKLCKL